MAHWGWNWKVKKKHIPRIICSKLALIKSFNVYRFNFIDGFTVQPVEVKTEPHPGHLKITDRSRKEHSYVIHLKKMPCQPKIAKPKGREAG